MSAIDAAPCMDCGVDTTPCTGKRGCRHAGRWDWYMVTAEVWAVANADSGFLCIPCLEVRLGRPVVSSDFAAAPVNLPSPWDTPRLAAARSRRAAA